MARHLAYSVLVLVVLGLALPAGADEAAERRTALREAQEPLRARDWPAAVQRLRLVRQQHAGTAEAREAWVLKARALLRAGAAREALDATSAFLAAHGESAWAGRMKHTAADAYAALSQPKEAAQALRERVEASTADAARAAVGALHLKLADDDFDGVATTDDLGREVKKRNVARALEAYRHAAEVGVAPGEATRVRERIALCLEELGKHGDAAGVWHALLEDVKQGEVLADSKMHERWLVGRGRARLRAGQRDEARSDLREALGRHPSGERHMEILLLLGDERLGAAAERGDEVAFEEGVTWIRRAVLEHRADERAAGAQKRLAEAYETQGQAEQAAAEWGALVERFPEDEFVPDARDRQAQALVRAGRFDEAIAAWERFLAAHPNHPSWQEVRKHIVAAAFAKGEARKEADDAEGAVAAWRAFAEKHPTDGRAPEALLRAGRLLREEKQPEAAIALWRQVGGRYASAPQAPAAALQVALTLEDDLARLEEVVKAYEELIEKHGNTSEANEARARLERLKAHHLELRLERVVGTKDAPVLRVTTRNIESLDVRVHRLEMEEYFQRKATVQGVENLQLEVVKPDLTATWEIEGYRPFALLEADREVPVKEAGAYVVVAGDEHLTATALFVVSDLEIVVKKARGRHLFVWAFQREDQAPVEGARVLVAEGEKVRELGRTGEDGIWQGSAGARAGHVLVLSEGGLAATELPEGPAVGTGFESKAYVYTDRPVYRPGQEVHWRAIFLKASGGSYLPPSGRRGTVAVRDARGQTLFEQEVDSSEFGAFTGAFPLDGAAPLGVWEVQLAVKHVGSWTGKFEVQEYRKPEFTLTLVPARPVYLTGESVEATAELRYAFGGPVAGATVAYEVYRVPRTFEPTSAESYAWYFRDDRREDAEKTPARPQGVLVARERTQTDDDGNAPIRFETAEKDEDAEYVVRVAVQDVTRRWIVDEGRIPVTRRDHMAVVRTDRRVYRPRQEMTVEVRTVDALERPTSRGGEVLLLELQRRVVPAPSPEPVLRGGRVTVVRDVEVQRAAYPLTTGRDGSAELKLQVPGPGRWRLRWRATDGRGALVTAFADAEAAGEAEDPSRDARLVAARTVYTEGDEAEVMLQSPVTGVTALLTYEGERVLAHRFLRIQGTSTLLSLPVGGELAPNVFFKVAIPHTDRLLEAETEVVVLRHLEVDVSLPPEAGPGEEVEVTIRTRDARGQGVAAEVGLALLDETLFAIAPDRAPSIRPYFYDRRRQNAVQTATSLGFRTYGTTRETNQDLLADEAARRGDLRKAMAASSLQGAQEALRRGDARTAAALALRAADADPDSFQARALLVMLRENASFRKNLEAADKALLDQLERTAPVAAATPSPEPAPAEKARWAREMDLADEEDLAFDGPAENAVIGLGGGAGGAFGGRGGRRLKSAGGGGRRREQQSQDAAVVGYLANKMHAHKDARGWGAANFGLDSGFVLELREKFADVAAWDAHVVTDANGRATRKVTLPDNLTTWRAVVRGVSATALVGEGRGRVLSRRDLLVRIDPPRFLVQGDAVTVPVAVHNQSGETQNVRVEVTAEGASLRALKVSPTSTDWSPGESTIELRDGALFLLDGDVDAAAVGKVRLEARAIGTSAADRTEVRLGTRPRGLLVVEGRTGVVATERGEVQETFLDVPEGVVPEASRLAVVLYPGLDAALLDALLYLDLYPYGCIEQTVHRFLPALDARVALLAAGSPAAARLDNLDEAVKRAATRLRNLQNDDGSFGWFRRGSGDLAMTSYALLGLTGAREAGVAGLDATIAKARDALVKLVRVGREDVRALAHYALARAGHLDQETYGTTFRRRRDDLSVHGLAWMTLAAHALGRAFDGDELAGLLLERRVEDEGRTHWKGAEGDCFVGSDREATGLVAQALLATGHGGEHAERALRWLLENRTKGGFGSTKDTAAFVGAASAWVRSHGAQGLVGGTIEVRLDGEVVRTVRVGPEAPEGLDSADRRFLVPEAANLEPGRHRLSFRLTGQGRLHWAVRLACVVASEELPAASHGLDVARLYLRPEEAPVEGQPPPAKPGYEILREAARPRVEAQMLETVGSGDRVLVRLELKAPRDLEYVLVEDPLPAGFEVLEGTAEGPFDWQERRDDRQVFFLTKVPKGAVVLRYVLQATHWGRFTALGTTAYPMYLPEVHGRAAGHVLSIAREGMREADAEHPPTPDELYVRAKALFAEGRFDDAAAIFRALRDEQPLRDEIVEEIEAHLLEAAIEADDAKEIVRAREALVRRNPARIPSDWDSQRAIAFAYHTLEEYEMASSLYGDLVARGFSLHTDWSRTLTARNREVEGLDALGDALRAFPVSNATANAAFRRAQRYRELPRPEGRAQPAGRPMDEETLDALWSFTAHYAETPLADPANYALVGALRRAGDLEGAARTAELFLERFPGSAFEDDTWYFLAESRFRTFEEEPTEDRARAVREAAKPLVERRFPVPGRDPQPSEFRSRGIHLLARVAHVLGDLDQAIQLYYQARALEDAREAHAFLTEERLDLESTLVVPLEGAITLPVRYRNVTEVAFKAYPVDLQVLFAVRKTLEGLHDIDLSGIVPVHQWTEAFEDAKDHMGHDGAVTVPVDAGKPGAWLVVAKAGDHEAKTLVVKTDLNVVLQRIGEKVRVHVTDAEHRQVKDAYVTVADGQRIRARGLTDGRGVFEAPGVGAEAAVVVSKDGRFAIAK